MLYKIKAGPTTDYILAGEKESIQIDTGFPGTLYDYYKNMGRSNLSVQNIKYLFLTHFHPDHIGLVMELIHDGVEVIIFENQLNFVHRYDSKMKSDYGEQYLPIKLSLCHIVKIGDSRRLLKKCGIAGEFIRTPGHSDDSVSLILDNHQAIVGDLYPYNQLVAYNDVVLSKSWDRLRHMKVNVVHFAHFPDEFL